MTIFMAARIGTGSLAATTMITSSVRAVLTRCTAIPVMMNFMVGESNDFLDGGPGMDILVGGEGADWLTGGSEPDRFLFIHGSLFETDSPSSNPDMIMDYNWKEGDIIVVEGSEQDPSFDNYMEAKIEYGAGYDAAKDYAVVLTTQQR